MIKTEIDARVLIKRLERLSAQAIPRAVGAALGRVAITTRAAAQREIRESIAIKAGTVNAAVTILRVPRSVNPDQLYVDLRAQGGPIPIRDYGATMTARGATFRVLRGRPKKVFRRRDRTGFIIGQKVASSSVANRRVRRRFEADTRFGGHVFTRVADESTPILRAYGPGIAQRFAGRAVQARIRETFQAQFPARLRQELAFQISRASGGR